MSGTPRMELDSDGLKIAAIREAWVAGVKASDVDRLLALMTEDVVIVDGKGRCASGIKEVKAKLLKRFGLFDIEQKISLAEVAVSDR